MPSDRRNCLIRTQPRIRQIKNLDALKHLDVLDLNGNQVSLH